ncbi:MAG: FecCD family ABC transporter permease, partial [Myxococcales bacterium]
MSAAAEPLRPILRGVRVTRTRAALVLGGLTLTWAAAVLLATAFGESELGLLRALHDPGSPERFVLLELRLPRILLATVVGAALAASGAALQALLRNALADPFVLGVSGGAALGGTLALALGAGALGAALASAAGALPPPVGPLLEGVLARSPATLCALAGAFFATAVVYFAGRFGGRLSPYAALLAGVIFNALASAAITFIKALSPPERVGELLYWLAGSLEYPEWTSVLGVAVFEALGIALLLLHARSLNLLSLGDEGAASLGVDVERVRRALFFGTSLCVAAAVAVSGLIGFVGLIVPHVLRLWLGPDQRLLLPASVLGGAAFLVLADLLARVLFTPLGTSTPVGVLTALIGGQIFLWLLRRAGAA